MESKTRELFSVIIIAFLMVQPLFDIYMAIVGESLDVLGISIVTLLRTTTTVTMLIFIAIYQLKNKYKIKWLITMLTYLLVVGIYAMLHHNNIVSNGGYFIIEELYSFITELMYVLRLAVPVILINVMAVVKPDKEKIEKTIVFVVFIIALVIILTNIFKISFASYSSEGGIIKYNVIDWFLNHNLSYRETLSKGFFVSANQIGALLTILLPIVVMKTIKEGKLFNYLTLLLGIISMILIGTRVASFGFIIVLITIVLAAIVIGILKKQKQENLRLIAIFILMLAGVVLYTKSPAKNRTFLSSEEGMYLETMKEIMDSEEYITVEEFKEILQDELKIKEYLDNDKEYNNTATSLKYEAMCKYIKEHYKDHAITNKYILQIYPYKEDPEFWLELLEQPVAIKGDNRGRQSVIIKRIKELNNNYLYDTLFGMGATPMNQREYMIENDLISHYYNIGLVGIIIFVSPYIIAMIFAVITMLRDIKGRLTLRLAAYCLCIVMTYGVGYFAGHVIDEYIITIFVAIISGLVINYADKMEVKAHERIDA